MDIFEKDAAYTGATVRKGKGFFASAPSTSRVRTGQATAARPGRYGGCSANAG